MKKNLRVVKDESHEPYEDSDDIIGVLSIVAICAFIYWMLS